MRSLKCFKAILLLVWASSTFVGQHANAHLMVAQQGTLNVIDDEVFMVLSLPVSAFTGIEGIDANRDGKVSMLEFNKQRGAIIASVRQRVTLSDQQGHAVLHGLMLSPVAAHASPAEPVSHLTVMGRFTLNDSTSALRLHIGLYGVQAAEQSLEITATRKSDRQKAVFKLTPTTPASVVFAARE